MYPVLHYRYLRLEHVTTLLLNLFPIVKNPQILINYFFLISRNRQRFLSGSRLSKHPVINSHRTSLLFLMFVANKIVFANFQPNIKIWTETKQCALIIINEAKMNGMVAMLGDGWPCLSKNVSSETKSFLLEAKFSGKNQADTIFSSQQQFTRRLFMGRAVFRLFVFRFSSSTPSVQQRKRRWRPAWGFPLCSLTILVFAFFLPLIYFVLTRFRAFRCRCCWCCCFLIL